MTAPSTASAQFSIGFSVNVAPPLIPVFAQPPIPGYGYIWTPGYWAWDPAFGYYWVPGEWVLPPEPGLLWTPGYWAWRDGVFGFISGYWGPTVGYYGGVDYGYGYGGLGYQGAEWRGGRLFYNRSANNFGGVRIATTFSRALTPRTRSRVSFNGGRGGLTVKPTSAEMAATRGRHVNATAAQVQRVHASAANPAFRSASVGHGRATAAVAAMHRTAQHGAPARGPAAAGRPARGAMTGRASPAGRATARTETRTASGAAAGPKAAVRTERGRAPANERAVPNRASVRAASPYERGGPTTRGASLYERGGPPGRASARSTGPRMEAVPRAESRPGGGMNGMGRATGGPMRGQAMRPAEGRAVPAARPEGARPSAPARGGGEDKGRPPG
jgi:hypothetical protein